MTRKAITCLVRSVILLVGGRSESADADTLCPACLILIPPTTTRSFTIAGISSEIAKKMFVLVDLPLQLSNLQKSVLFELAYGALLTPVIKIT